jgi:hypothetical protein
MYEVLGEDAVKGFFVSDRVHSTLRGATVSAQLVVFALSGLSENPVDAYLRRDEAVVQACKQ